MEGAKTTCDYCAMPISAMSIRSAQAAVWDHLYFAHTPQRSDAQTSLAYRISQRMLNGDDVK